LKISQFSSTKKKARGIKSIIDYIIINNKFKTKIRHIEVLKVNEVDSDHFLLESKFYFFRQGLAAKNLQNMFKIIKNFKLIY
jgi:hypothetical protein